MTVAQIDRDRTLDLFALYHRSSRTADDLYWFLSCAPGDAPVAIANLSYPDSRAFEEWLHMAPRDPK